MAHQFFSGYLMLEFDFFVICDYSKIFLIFNCIFKFYFFFLIDRLFAHNYISSIPI